MLGSNTVHAQYKRYLDSIFSDVTKSTVQYSDIFVDNYHKMDIYTPSNDSLKKRPLIVYVHGGSFFAGDKGSKDCIDFCTSFAKKGYVAVSVNYRLANALLFLSDKKVQLNAVLQSIADIKAALRYFVKDASGDKQYRLDTNAFFLGGYSAGGVASFHTAWVTSESEMDANLQKIMKTGIKTLNGDAGNNGYSNPIKAIFSMAGGLYQMSYLSAGDLPVWMGHAMDDATVSYNCAPAFNNSLIVTLCGTGKIIPKLDTTKVKYDTMILKKGGHNWPSLGNSGKDFKRAVTEISEFFYPMIPSNSASQRPTITHRPISVYPNPTQGTLFIEHDGAAQLGQYRLLNSIGQTVLTGNLQQNRQAIDVGHLPKGMYHLICLNPEIKPLPIIIE